MTKKFKVGETYETTAGYSVRILSDNAAGHRPLVGEVGSGPITGLFTFGTDGSRPRGSSIGSLIPHKEVEVRYAAMLREPHTYLNRATGSNWHTQHSFTTDDKWSGKVLKTTYEDGVPVAVELLDSQ